MLIKWDENKRITNLKKHHLDFIDAKCVFSGHTLTFEDARYAYGEQRFISFGALDAVVIAIVHTESNDSIRVISMRKATKQEEKYYYASITN